MITREPTLDDVIDALTTRHPQADPKRVAACVYATYNALKDGAVITTHLLALTQRQTHDILRRAARTDPGRPSTPTAQR